MQNRLFKSSPIASVVSYIFIMFIVSSFILLALIFLTSMTTGYDYYTLSQAFITRSDHEELRVLASKILSIGNFLTYLLLLIVICFYMRDYLKEDFKFSYKKILFTSVVLVLSSVGFYFITLGIEILISQHVPDSENQISVIEMIVDGFPLLTFIAVVICAPVVEELIFRKAIFKLLDKKPIIAFLISTLIFAFMHMTSTQVGGIDWLLISIPYLASAILLCSIYLISKKNIWVVIIVHMLNNLLSFIFIIQEFM